MTEESKNSSIDLLGIKPISDAASKTVDKTFQGIEGFLKSVCAPALDEIGLMLRDKVRYWRLNNILRVIEKAKGKLSFENEQLQIEAHPRVGLAIIENASLNDNDEVQDMWAGLFASSCTNTKQDDENLIFVDLLKQLTVAEARIVKFACEGAQKILHENGLIVGDYMTIECKSLMEITGITEIHRLDRELDHLRALTLIGSSISGGFIATDKNLVADISPTPLALNLYVKSQGHNGNPVDYWQENILTQAEKAKKDQEEATAAIEKQRVETEKRKQEQLTKKQTPSSD